ncbi:hypothetical protein F0562_022547 [Nyssa sinensis]|uniref:Uncharacterized protein n=1 Tax=Nyssa sinensis TaxID=561372 RepID=A0A5J5BN73_9ASTE|nr:hypothetical protein F0562_022547 [Nyssa sinensis]
MNGSSRDDGEKKGLLWMVPVLKSKELGKLGPALGVGAGCGFGFGIGLIGGTGFGLGIPGLKLGLGLGAGCGVGLGVGYGMGRGIAYDHQKHRHTNVGNIFNGMRPPVNLPSQDEIGAFIDEFAIKTKELIQATSGELVKWRK